MNAMTRYADAWEGFWKGAPPQPGSVFWDAAAERAAAAHLPYFAGHFGGRPVVDLGCGNGTQTHFLAGLYDPVIGVDVSSTAVGLAVESGDSAARFRTLDATDAEAVAGLRADLGESDVYVRGVLHQCEPEDRARIAGAIAALVGEHGRAFVVEPAAAGAALLGALTRRPEGPPPELAAVFAHGIRPLEMPDASVPALFSRADLAVLSRGTAPLALTVTGPEGEAVTLPSNWLVVGRQA